jgi:hypothetical protein
MNPNSGAHLQNKKCVHVNKPIVHQHGIAGTNLLVSIGDEFPDERGKHHKQVTVLTENSDQVAFYPLPNDSKTEDRDLDDNPPARFQKPWTSRVQACRGDLGSLHNDGNALHVIRTR